MRRLEAALWAAADALPEQPEGDDPETSRESAAG